MLQLRKSICLENLGLPFKEALSAARDLGADAVEINGRNEIPASQLTRTAVRQINKMLDDNRLKISAIYFPTRRGLGNPNDLERRIDAIKQAMQMAFQLRSRLVICRIGSLPEDHSSESWQTMLQALTDLGNYSQRAGAWLAARTEYGQGESLKPLIEELPDHALGVDFDPADFVIHGKDPAVGLDVLADDVRNFRARDAVTDLARGSIMKGVEVQLGRGSVDLPAMLGKLEERHFEGYLTVERNEADNTLEQLDQSLQYLTRLFQE